MRKPLEYINPGFVCAEIGVWQGNFSTQILEQAPSKLYLIDPWLFQPEFRCRMYGGKIAKNQTDMDNIYENVSKVLGPLAEVQIIRKKSADAISDILDEELDWVYIDGNHEYKYVLEDLNNYYPKLKSGGFLTGDDYQWKNPAKKRTVKMAVDKFCKEMDLHAEIFGNQFVITKES